MSTMLTNTQQGIETQLKEIFGQLLGVNLGDADSRSSFLEVGADSLLLLQASQWLQNAFGVKVPFRALLEEYSTFEELAEFLQAKAPDYAATAPLENVANYVITAPLENAGIASIQQMPLQGRPVHAEPAKISYEDLGSATPGVEHIIKQQLHIMSQQLEVLRSMGMDVPVHPLAVAAEKTVPTTATHTITPSSDHQQNNETQQNNGQQMAARKVSSPVAGQAASQQVDPETYVPYQPRRVAQLNGLTGQQKQHIETLVAHYAKRTQKSKQLAQESRHYHADNRGTAGFNLTFKEIVYPLVIKHAQGAHIWDIDDNEYVDIAMGFGALLFGHSPSFVIEAIEQQLKHGIGLGLQSDVVGKAAQLLCELTGAERASFCNSGTEAVMTALRLARAITGRNKVVVFGGAFHGTFDGVLVRGQENPQEGLKTIPLAPGVTSHLIGDVTLARFGEPESLDMIRENAYELAAVLVELPQSRRPDLIPLQFVRELRKITAEAGVALVFDEVVSGFRSHPGGSQALFGIKADLAAYGKAFAGGLPVAAIAGKAEYMAAVDGGVWNYGDSSYPDAIQTFFAGTYFKHPLLMPAVYAILSHLKQSGPQLQERLNRRTEEFARQLDRFFEEEHAPIRTIRFGSLFRFSFPPHYKGTDANIFYYHILENGVNLPETRNGFLSTAHTDEDIEHILWAIKDAFHQTRAGGFLSGSLDELESSL